MLLNEERAGLSAYLFLVHLQDSVSWVLQNRRDGHSMRVCGEGLGKEDVGYKRGTPLPAYLESGCNILHKFLSNSGTTDPGPSWEKSRKGHIEPK